MLPLFLLGYGLACAPGLLVLTQPRRREDVVRPTEVAYVLIALVLGAAYVFSTPAAWRPLSAGWPGIVFWGIGVGVRLVVPLGPALGAWTWKRFRPVADRLTPWLILLGAVAIRQTLLYAAKGG